MKPNELQALISLLSDPNESVYTAVETKLLDLGADILPQLKQANKDSQNDVFKQQSAEIIEQIAFSHAFKNFKEWLHKDSHHIFDGAFWIAKYIYPEIEYRTIMLEINKIANDAWLQMNHNLTPLEQIKVLNHIIYHVHKFTRNHGNLYSQDNSCINKVMENKRGNPVLLAILYLIIARKVGLPVYGVNLPRNFIIAYVKENISEDKIDVSKRKVLFYANPYQDGAVLTKHEIESFLKQQKIKAIPQFFQPCDDKIAIQRTLLSLFISFRNKKDFRKIKDIQKFINEFKNRLPDYNM